MSSDLEKAIVSHLAATGADKSRISELAAAASRINVADLKGLRILTKGTPVPDWVRLSGLVDHASAAKFIGQVLTVHGHLGGITIFPYGIPSHEMFQVNVDFGPGAPHPG